MHIITKFALKNAGFVYLNTLCYMQISAVFQITIKCVVTLNLSRVFVRGIDLYHAFLFVWDKLHSYYFIGKGKRRTQAVIARQQNKERNVKMSKKLLSLLTALSVSAIMLMPLSASAGSGAGGSNVSIDGQFAAVGGKLVGDITAEYVVPGGGITPKYILAVYDEGALAYINVSENGQFSLADADNVWYTAGTSDCKLFVWDEDYEPFCEPVGSEQLIVNSVSFAAADFYDDMHSDSENLYFYAEGSTSRIRCRISGNADWLVNGYPINAENAIEDYLIGNYFGTVTLTADAADGESDVIYDSVNITYYTDAVVDEVTSNDGLTEIKLLACDPELTQSDRLTVSAEQNITVKGDAASLAELQKYDVLSVQSEPYCRFEECDNIITVARKYGTGIVTKTKGNTIANGACCYFGDECCYPINTNLSDNLSVFALYTFYTDAFGYISYAEEYVGMKNYAVINSMYRSAGAVCRINITTAAGERLTYDYYKQSDVDFINAAGQYAYNLPDDASWTDLQAKNLKPVKDRVITYRLDSSQRIRIISGLNGTEITDGAYSADTNSLGDIKLRDGVKMIDAADYVEDESSSVQIIGALNNGSAYSAYAYNYGDFLIVTKGETIHADAQHGAVDKMYYDERSSMYKINVMGVDRVVNTYNYQIQNKKEFMCDALYLAYNANPVFDVTDLKDSTLKYLDDRAVIYAVTDGKLKILAVAEEFE